jgi:hypothetical protein
VLPEADERNKNLIFAAQKLQKNNQQ